MEKMLIPITYEEMSEELKNEIPKLTQIVQPVISVENDINIILANIKQTGNILFFHGKSGVGKSTFLDSLKWRSHITKRTVTNIDSSELVPESGLNGLFLEIKSISEKASKEADKGPTIIILLRQLNTAIMQRRRHRDAQRTSSPWFYYSGGSAYACGPLIPTFWNCGHALPSVPALSGYC